MISKKWVCSLELARRLRELGVKQDSDFYYCSDYPGRVIENDGENCSDMRGDPVSAFHVGELGEMLNGRYLRMVRKEPDMSWSTQLKSGGTEGSDTEADARAKKLVYLIESREEIQGTGEPPLGHPDNKITKMAKVLNENKTQS